MPSKQRSPGWLALPGLALFALAPLLKVFADTRSGDDAAEQTLQYGALLCAGVGLLFLVLVSSRGRRLRREQELRHKFPGALLIAARGGAGLEQEVAALKSRGVLPEARASTSEYTCVVSESGIALWSSTRGPDAVIPWSVVDGLDSEYYTDTHRSSAAMMVRIGDHSLPILLTGGGPLGVAPVRRDLGAGIVDQVTARSPLASGGPRAD